jgi:hypothetical protein
MVDMYLVYRRSGTLIPNRPTDIVPHPHPKIKRELGVYLSKLKPKSILNQTLVKFFAIQQTVCLVQFFIHIVGNGRIFKGEIVFSLNPTLLDMFVNKNKTGIFTAHSIDN